MEASIIVIKVQAGAYTEKKINKFYTSTSRWQLTELAKQQKAKVKNDKK